MKKYFSFFCLFLLAPACVHAPAALASENSSSAIEVDIDGQTQELSHPPVVINNQTMVPLRDIFQLLGAQVKWDPEGQKIIATNDKTQVVVQLNSQTAYKDSKEIQLSEPVQLIDEKTMVPLRFISEAFGANVTWSNSTNSVIITTQPSGSVYYRDKVIVLDYHHLASNGSAYTITPELLREQFDALKEYGYHVIGMMDYLKFVENGDPIPPNAVVLTFDDGYESFYKIAYPELLNFHYPATNFLIVRYTDEFPSTWVLPHLTWDEIKEMKSHGMTFFSHTYNLHHLANTSESGDRKPVLAYPIYQPNLGRIETQEEYRNRIKNDLLKAETLIHAQLGDPQQTSLLCFPYGEYNATVLDVGKELGTVLFFTVKEGINDKNQRLVYRINAGSDYVSANKLIKTMQKYK